MTTSCNTFRLQTDIAQETNGISGIQFSTAEWNYFGISESSDFSMSVKSMVMNNQVVELNSSDEVITGPNNGNVFLGSFEGLIKFFSGYIYQFQYFTSANVGN